MKALHLKFLLLTAAAGFGALEPRQAAAQPVGDSYTNTILPGLNLIANHLDKPDHTLNSVLPIVPDGSQAYKWDEVIQDFLGASYDVLIGGWVDIFGMPSTMTLGPREALFLDNLGAAYPLVFTGEPRTPTPPPALTRNALHYLSRQTKATARFEDLAGQPPEEGALLLRWDAATQVYQTNRYTGGQWQPGEPMVNIGEGVAIWLPPGPPVITMQPQGQRVLAGTDAVFQVAAGSSLPLTYQWQFYGEDIGGANSDTLTVTNVQLPGMGAYSVIVANGSGAVTSAPAILLVDTPQLPEGPRLRCPSNVTLYASGALGAPVEYGVAVNRASDGSAPMVVCLPPSGSFFRVGSWLVECFGFSAQDVTNQCGFTVTVQDTQPPSNAPPAIRVFAPGETNSPVPVGLDEADYRCIATVPALDWGYDVFHHFTAVAQLGDASTGFTPAEGMLFGGLREAGGESHAIAVVPRSGRWTAHVWSGGGPAEAVVEDNPSVSAAGEVQFDCLFVPWNTPRLVGGWVVGDMGSTLQQAGEFEVKRTDVGRYELTLPGKNPDTGKLLINAASLGASLTDESSRPLFTQQYVEGKFLIQSRAAIPSANGFDPAAPLLDADFVFAWMDFVDPTAATNGLVPVATGVTVRQVNADEAEVAWLAATAAAQFELQMSENLSDWSPVPVPPVQEGDLLKAMVPLNGRNTFFRLLSPRPPSSCPNGNFENGDFTGFSGATGQNIVNASGVDTGTYTSGLVAGRHTIMPDLSWAPSGYDPVVGGTVLPVVKQGARAARLGNWVSGAQKESLAYTFTVDNQNQFFSFNYATVLENPPHIPSHQPRFEYLIYTQKTPNPFQNPFWWKIIKSFSKFADGSDPYFTTAPGGYLYRNWDCEPVFLGNYIGQQVTIAFATKDCSDGGHFGYAYIDSLCERQDDFVNPSFTLPTIACPSDPIIADGSASVGENHYFWNIECSDQWWGRYPSTQVGRWYLQQAGPIDLKAFYASFGGSFQCNKYYRVGLAVANGCVGWKATVRLIYFKCPVANAGPDKILCGSGGSHVQLGTPAIPGNTYSWSPAGAFNFPNVAQPVTFITPPPGSCYAVFPFTLTVTDPQGCRATDTVEVRYYGPPRPNIADSGRRDCCDATRTLTVTDSCGPFPPGTTFRWLPGGQTSQSINVTPSTTSSTTYTVQVMNPCSTISRSITIPADPVPVPNGNYPTWTYRNFVAPNHPNPALANFYVKDDTKDCGAPGAYSATEYYFRVYDRWGHVIAERGGSGCGFANCTIPYWNGTATRDTCYPWRYFLPKLRSGTVLQQGVYTWEMSFKNCANSGWHKVFKPTSISVFP